MQREVKINKNTPHDTSNFLTRWFYTWTLPLFNIGWVRQLNFDDLYLCPKEDDPTLVTEKLEREWKKELAKGKLKASLSKAILRAFGWRFLQFNIILCINEIFIPLTQPFMIGYILRYMKQDEDADINNSRYIYPQFTKGMAALIVLSAFIFILSRHYCWSSLMRIGNVSSAVTVMIFKEVLTMSRS